MPRISKSEKTEAVARLREWLKPDQVVFCILRNRSASGMSRTIQLVTFTDDMQPLFLGYNAHLATGHGWDEKREGVRVGGCGMDMGFALVDDLSAAVGLKLKRRWL
jgi:hypothetical protein